MSDGLEPPDSTAWDKALAIGKGAIGEIPFGGSTAAELIGVMFGTPLENRRKEWEERVASAIRELQGKGLTIEKLRDDPLFVDTVLRASSVAMCTHRQEKLDALRNAIVNSGLPRPIDDDLRQMFLGMIERFTPWHIRLLVLFDNPLKWFGDQRREYPRHLSQTYLDKLAFAAYPDLQKQPEFTEQVCRELQQNGLVTRNDIGIVRMSDEPTAPRTLDLGKQFVRFIQEPQQ